MRLRRNCHRSEPRSRVTCQPYYLIEYQHYAVLSARISGSRCHTLTSSPKSSLERQTSLPGQSTREHGGLLGYDNSELARRKTRHKGQPTGGVVRSGHSTCPAPKQRKRCVSTHEGLPVRYWRKVGMTSSPHGPYGLGHTRATMAMKAVRRSESRKIASVRIVLCNSGT
jgi:hypothetical protein